MLGGVEFSVDGQPVEFSKTFAYKGMMFSGVPNLVSTFGYINTSWTLRADLISEYVCRLINYMEEKDLRQCTPTLREEDQFMAPRPFIDGFPSGYVQRKMHLFPKQGDREPWLTPQNYRRDNKRIRRAPIEDGVLVFRKRDLGVRRKAGSYS